jgi:hypothetical protein
MNRRNYLRSLLAFAGVGIGSISVFKWLEPAEYPGVITLYDWNRMRPIISELAEIIIPATNTPGAKEAKVENYIISVMSECSDKRQQNVLFSGLIEVENFAKNRFGKSFLACDPSSKFLIVEHLSSGLIDSSNLLLKIKHKLFGKSFFVILRELTVEGFCTSYLGATKALSYDHVPGSYQSCIPLSSQQKSWATK